MLGLLLIACSLPEIPDHLEVEGDTADPEAPLGYDVDIQPRAFSAAVIRPDCENDPEATLEFPLGSVWVAAYEEAPVYLSVKANSEWAEGGDGNGEAWYATGTDRTLSERLVYGEDIEIPVFAWGGCGEHQFPSGEMDTAMYIFIGDEYVTTFTIDFTIDLQ